MSIITEADLHLLFLDARSQNGWLDRPVEDALLRRIYEIARMAPTSANSQPMRVLFLKSPEAKARLKPALSPGNVEKTMAAPVTAIVAHDLEFYEQLPKLMPHVDARSWFAGAPDEKKAQVAFQNGTLQGAYLMLAARAVGLDVGPMGGFDNAKVDAEFLPDGKWKSNFLLNLGHGDPAKLFPRNPRLEFEEACRIV
ncbi:MAG: malonic semialdehyde reductase [Byssovorax sp.]